MKKIIGVMGSSHGIIPQHALDQGYIIGQEIAKRGFVLLTGGTLGIPQTAVKGAQDNEGLTLVISPGHSIEEHEKKYKSSIDSDIYIYTGMGNMGRNLFNVRSSDAIIFICGGIGTLSEFSIAFAEGKLIGILNHTGGISDEIKNIIKICKRKNKNKVIYNSNPYQLISKISSLITYENSNSKKR